MRSLRYLTVEGFKNMWVNRLMSIASIGVLSACMLIMGAAILFSANVDRALHNLQDQNVVMAFITDETDDKGCQKVVEDIKQIPNVKLAALITKEDAIKRVMEQIGENNRELYQDVNMPNGVEITMGDLEDYDSTVLRVKSVENIDSVRDERELAMQITELRRAITVAGFWIIGLLMITALVIIANTIRITMHSRKLEISIMKAVGATNNFIRLPFVVEGMVMGIISAGLTTGVLYFVYKMTISEPESGGLKMMDIMSHPVPFSEVLWQIIALFAGMGIVIGCIGSVFSLGKYLKKEGSEFRAF